MTTGIRETKKRKTRQAILLAAVNLFRERGFEQTSVEELARASGIGKGTIYGYFKTKGDILRALGEEKLERLHEDLITDTKEGIPVLRQMVDFYMSEFTLITQNRELARLFMQQTTFPRDTHMEQHLANAEICTLLAKARERGELRKDMDLPSIICHFYGLYLLLVSAWFHGRVKTERAETVLDTLFRQALEGMQPRSKHSTQNISIAGR